MEKMAQTSVIPPSKPPSNSLFVCPPGPPRCPFYTFLPGHKRNVSHLFPAFHFNFHFICISFPPGFLITPPQSITPFLIAAAASALSLSLLLLSSLHLLLPKRRRDLLSIAEKVIFPLLSDLQIGSFLRFCAISLVRSLLFPFVFHSDLLFSVCKLVDRL